jgi:hypothetical protein
MSNARKISDIIVGTEVKVSGVDSDLSNKVADIKSRLDSDDGRLQSLDTSINSKISTIKGRLDSDDGKLQQLDTLIKSNLTNLADSDVIVNQITAKVNSVISNLDSDTTAVQAINTQILSIKNRLDSDDAKLQSLDTTIVNIKSRLDSDDAKIQAVNVLATSALSASGMKDSDLKVVAELRNDVDSEIIYARNLTLSYTNFLYNATAGQTSFSGSDANSLTLAYTAGSILVFLNGIKLEGEDYTATDGTTIVLSEAAAVNNQLVIVVPIVQSNYIIPPVPPVQVTDSRYAVINISANQDFDSDHSEAILRGGGDYPYSVFKDETGNTSPRPKHVDNSGSRIGHEYGSGTMTFHTNLSPYHSGGWSASFAKNKGVQIQNDGSVNNPGTGACTWEFWVFIRPQHHSQNPNNSSKRSIAISGATSSDMGGLSNGTWAVGIHGIQGSSTMGTGTGLYLAYRQSNTNYLKTWNEGREDSEIERNKWHHVAIVRTSGTDGAGVYKAYMNGEQMESEDYATFPDNMNGSRTYSWWGGYGGEYGTAAYGGGLYGNIMDYRLTHDAKYTSDGFDVPTSPMNVGGFPASDVNVAWPWGPSMRPRSGQSTVGTGLSSTTNINNWNREMRKLSATAVQNTMTTNVEHSTMERLSPYNYDTEDYNKAGSVTFLPRGNGSRQLRTGLVSNAVTYGNIESISNSNGTAGDGGINLGSGPCTIEWWANCNGSITGCGNVSQNNEEQSMVDFRPDSSYGRPHVYVYRTSDNNNRIRVSHSNSGSAAMDEGTIKILSGSWYHFAYVREGQYVKFYINGTRVDGSGSGMYVGTANWSGTDARPFWGTSSRVMRTDSSSIGGNFSGLIADCRVTVGTAVYTGNFTPPTKPLTTTGGTYPLSTNIASIGSGHVKQLLQFKNNPIQDTAGSQPFMAPTLTNTNTGGLPPKLVVSDEDGISNWPTSEASALGGGSTAGKKYMYFYGGGSASSNKMVKNFLAWPTKYFDSFVHSASGNGGLSMFSEIPNTQANQRRGVAVTLEFWIYPHQSNTGEEKHFLISYGSHNESSGKFALSLVQQSSPGSNSSTGNQFAWVFEEDTTSYNFATGQSFNQWYHVALVFAGSLGAGAEWRLFVNGTRDTTRTNVQQTTGNLFRSGGALSLGSSHLRGGGEQEFNGHSTSPNRRENFHGLVRNFRVEHRAKYWDSNFTPTDFTLK